MSLNYASALHVMGSVTGATGAAVFTAGGVATARTAKGVYTLTLDQQLDATQCVCFGTTRGAAGAAAEVAIAQTSDGVKTLSIIDNAGAAQDFDFDFIIFAAPLAG